MAMYKLSIEERINAEGVTQRTIIATNGAFHYKEWHDPNAKSKKPFKYEGHQFNTPFSIVHPFRKVARGISLQGIYNGSDSKPVIKYDASVNPAQRDLFENILAQEYESVKELEEKGLPQQGF